MIVSGTIEAAVASATPAAGAATKAEAPDPAMLKAAKEFESIFVRQMLKSLERTTAAGGNTKPTAGQSSYGSMIVDSLSESIAKAGGLGLADVLARSLMAAHPAPRPTQASSSTAAAADPPRLYGLKPLK